MPPEKKDIPMIAATTTRPAGDAGVSMTYGHVGIDATQNFRTIDPIAKSHVIKFDGASRAGSIIGRLRRSVQDIVQPTTGPDAPIAARLNSALRRPNGASLNLCQGLKLL
jgi:hypothetical protein